MKVGFASPFKAFRVSLPSRNNLNISSSHEMKKHYVFLISLTLHPLLKILVISPATKLSMKAEKITQNSIFFSITDYNIVLY